MPKTNSRLSKAERFYRKNQGGTTSKQVIKDYLRDKDAIVFGARAVNRHLPDHLDKHTEDWDILTTRDPQVAATEIERSLDRRYGGNFFSVEPALHPGTFKIKSNVTEKTVADVSGLGLDETIPNIRIRGINYATLDHQVRQIRRSLADPQSSFRHAKDRESLQRIDIFRKNNPTYYVRDLAEIMRDDFGVKVTRTPGQRLVLRDMDGDENISPAKLSSITTFIDEFYPQIVFETAGGKAILKRRQRRPAAQRGELIRRRKMLR